ncbi:MAG TPA: hypothetical protein VG713_22030, partial [Pirellulales bacterium]|nr:hypothetical protein [Pirellulales bacterium]
HESVDRLIANFWSSGGRGQIVGAHGSGKSTLLRAMLGRFEESGHATVLIELHSHQRRLPMLPRLPASPGRPPVVAIDGFEQLGAYSSWRVARWCKRRNHGLLLTTHRRHAMPFALLGVRLPVLYHTRPTLALVHEIVRALVDDRDNRINSVDVEQSLAQHPGDVRETLFRLYELYEARRRER